MLKSLWLNGKQLTLPENKPGLIESHLCMKAGRNSIQLFSNPCCKLLLQSLKMSCAKNVW